MAESEVSACNRPSCASTPARLGKTSRAPRPCARGAAPACAREGGWDDGSEPAGAARRGRADPGPRVRGRRLALLHDGWPRPGRPGGYVTCGQGGWSSPSRRPGRGRGLPPPPRRHTLQAPARGGSARPGAGPSGSPRAVPRATAIRPACGSLRGVPGAGGIGRGWNSAAPEVCARMLRVKVRDGCGQERGAGLGDGAGCGNPSGETQSGTPPDPRETHGTPRESSGNSSVNGPTGISRERPLGTPQGKFPSGNPTGAPPEPHREPTGDSIGNPIGTHGKPHRDPSKPQREPAREPHREPHREPQRTPPGAPPGPHREPHGKPQRGDHFFSPAAPAARGKGPPGERTGQRHPGGTQGNA
ncbi:basic salivary proline-rich protein 1-like [Manacus vitellinus]|uniref:basic salivary proline-rich protein 1-like n=1 Tax=Manacus vitellinus TaxID=328815 RepID=UPI00115D01B3|nr:basic salivary proline-rich protein 1-like [Manacus vitellinus]